MASTLIYGSPSVCAPFIPNTSWADEMDEMDRVEGSKSTENLAAVAANNNSAENSDAESTGTDSSDKQDEMTRGAGELTPKKKPSNSFTPKRMKLKDIYPAQRGFDQNESPALTSTPSAKILVKENVDFPDSPPFTAFISNMNLDTTKDDLYSHFGKYGRIVKVKVIWDREANRSKGFSYVEYCHPESLRSCLKANGSFLGGKELLVVIADRERKKEGNAVSSVQRKNSYSEASFIKKVGDSSSNYSRDHAYSKDYSHSKDHSYSKDQYNNASNKGRHSQSSTPSMKNPGSFSSPASHEYKVKSPSKVGSVTYVPVIKPVSVEKKAVEPEPISPSKPASTYSGAMRHMNAPKKRTDELPPRRSTNVAQVSNSFALLSTSEET